MPKHVLIVFGTRPEAIKMAPVIRAIQEAPDMECVVLATAQHRQMLDQVLQVFGITPDIDLDIMHPNQTLTGLTGRLLLKLEDALSGLNADALLAQGDTTSVLASALAALALSRAEASSDSRVFESRSRLSCFLARSWSSCCTSATRASCFSRSVRSTAALRSATATASFRVATSSVAPAIPQLSLSFFLQPNPFL